MKISPIYQLAINASVKASEIIMTFYNEGFNSKIKSDGSPVTGADIASSIFLKDELQKTGIPIIDEESTQIDYEIRKHWKKNWCVDPLDGTKEFIHKNGEFSVNIALIENQRAIFGIIASPVNQEILVGGKDFGVYILKFEDSNDYKKWKKIDLTMDENNYFSLVSSRSHESTMTLNFINELRNSFGNFGMIEKGSALKFFDLAQNEASIYPRFAPTMEWDIAAGQAILEELGGKVISSETFEPLKYNKKNLMNPHFIGITKNLLSRFESTFQNIK